MLNSKTHTQDEVTKVTNNNLEIEWKQLCNQEKGKLKNLCSIFADVLTTRLVFTQLIEYDIVHKEDKVVRSQLYKLAPPEMVIMRQHVNELLEKGIIEPSYV